VKARYHLIQCDIRRHDDESALKRIGEALFFDKDGEYRQRLLDHQTEILDRLAHRERCARELPADRLLLEMDTNGLPEPPKQ
jgi:hypothetical protein